jgi:phosphoribosylformylglycinamidine (FGAM) synthase-like enzyme
VPVVGGNVSFYNQTDGVDIYPTPVAGMLGFCDPMPHKPPRLDRAEEGMAIWVVGQEPKGDFAASAYDRIINHNLGGRPEQANAATARAIVADAARLAFTTPVLHDISTGGLAVALAEIGIKSGLGFSLEDTAVADLFDETPLRFVAVGRGDLPEADQPYRRIGTMTGDTFDFGAAGSIEVKEATSIWMNALPRRLA